MNYFGNAPNSKMITFTGFCKSYLSTPKKIKTRKYYDTKSLYEIDPIERILLGFEIGILYIHHGQGIFESERAVPVERHLG